MKTTTYSANDVYWSPLAFEIDFHITTKTHNKLLVLKNAIERPFIASRLLLVIILFSVLDISGHNINVLGQ